MQDLILYLYYETTSLKPSVSSNHQPRRGGPILKLLLLVLGRSSEIHIAPQHFDHKFEPVGFLQARQDLSRSLGAAHPLLVLQPSTILHQPSRSMNCIPKHLS